MGSFFAEEAAMRFKSPHGGHKVEAITETLTGKVWVARCLGVEAYGSTENQALKALKNIMAKQGWRVVK
jgi:hypothetical protein